MLQSPTLKPGAEEDELAQEFMRELFDRHFTEYGRALKEVEKLKDGEFPVPVPDNVLYKKPHLVAKSKIGSFASRTYATLPVGVAA